ncbi:MAG: Ig-like domain-containing protein [Candidatus Poseidoniaceae archaeon]|nr:Ig-like domain-containing protein [Candidatus Poseidoniaceae archaeon]
MRKAILSLLVTLLLVQISSPVLASSPASIDIDSHQQTVSADQAIRFTAVVKDNSGNPINEQITWSASSGTIDSDGLFTPGMVGQTIITATSGNVNSTTTVQVTAGWPVGIQSGFNLTEVSIDDTISLNATLVDRAGNPVSGDLTWRCQNGEIDYDNMTWKPDEVGSAVMRIIYLELEIQVVFNVVPGNPTSLEIPFGLTVQSGNTIHIIPVAKDARGNEVGISKAGELTWSSENGSISPSGIYFGGAPGLWNLSVNSTSGAFGSGVIRVLPAQATGLDIEMDVTQARTGSPVTLSAIRTDVLGNSGEVVLPLANWTVPTGSLSMEGDSVVWIPSKIGDWTIGVSDQGFSATMQVNVIQGEVTGIEILLSENVLNSGELVVASISAYDAAGNQRAVDGAWTIASELSAVDQGDWMQLRPGPIGNFTISATWFDNETQLVHEVESIVHVTSGELARIVLPESGTRVPSDGVLELQPIFEDEYGNVIDEVLVTWVIDDIDMTMEIRLAGDRWAPSSLGMHEIRAMSQGVFAITDVEVIAGTARHISTNFDDGIEVASAENVEIEISTLDVHGNVALASDITFEFEDPQGVVSPSSKGDGYWVVTGGQAGEWNLRLTTGSATQDIAVVVSPGQAVRLLADIPEQNPEEGSSMIIRIHAIDQAGNRIEVPPADVTIKCTTGPATHLAGDTYEVSIEQSGQSQSCNAYWDDLVAQRFFDVDAVLFGGGLGDSNTALTMVSIIVFLFIAIMVVLIRRLKGDQDDVDYWEDEYEEYEEDSISEETYQEEIIEEPEVKSEPVPVVAETTEEQPSESKEDLRARLAAEAKRTGVMQAAPGTEQGKTGWYIDSDGQLTSWLVSESGEWTRMS